MPKSSDAAAQQASPDGCPCGHPIGGVCDDTHGTCASADCARQEVS